MNTPTRCWAHVAHTQRLSPEWMWAGDLDEWGVGCVSVSPKGVCLCVYQSSRRCACWFGEFKSSGIQEFNICFLNIFRNKNKYKSTVVQYVGFLKF